MKRLYFKIGLSSLAGILTAIWVADKLPLLRGGVVFQPAPSVAEQLANERSVLQPRTVPTRLESVQSVKYTYDQLLTWQSRQALIKSTTTDLLPGKWEDALEILIAYSRGRELDEQLLAEILRAGGPEAFRLAARSGKINPRKLGMALRESGLSERSAIINTYLKESSDSHEDLAIFLVQAVEADGDEIEALSTMAGVFLERFGAKGLVELAERFTDAEHLTGNISRGEVLDTLNHFSKNAYLESVVDYQKRLATREDFDAASDNPKLAGTSEIRRHLSIETYGKLRNEGDEATLQWALTKPAREFQKGVIEEVLFNAALRDGLRPILLALRSDSDINHVDLVDQAIAATSKGQKFARTLYTKQETFDEVSRLGQHRPDIANILEMFHDRIR